MTTSPCDREQEMVKALRSGLLSSELRAHVSGCAECSEVMMIAQFLQRETNSLEAIPIPNASLVWQRAASRSRAEALARATRPIQWVVHASVAVTFAATLWLIFDLAGSLSSLAGAVSAAGQHVGGTWIYASIITGAVTMLGIVAGAMYMLSVDKERARFVKTY